MFSVVLSQSIFKKLLVRSVSKKRKHRSALVRLLNDQTLNFLEQECWKVQQWPDRCTSLHHLDHYLSTRRLQTKAKLLLPLRDATKDMGTVVEATEAKQRYETAGFSQEQRAWYYFGKVSKRQWQRQRQPPPHRREATTPDSSSKIWNAEMLCVVAVVDWDGFRSLVCPVRNGSAWRTESSDAKSLNGWIIDLCSSQ